MDLPISIKNISYEAIEHIKDGIICNNKFKCGSFIMNSPNVLIMCNQIPNISKLPKDRLSVYTLDNFHLKKIEI